MCYECYLYQGNKDSADADNPHGDDEKDTEVEMYWDIFAKLSFNFNFNSSIVES